MHVQKLSIDRLLICQRLVRVMNLQKIEIGSFAIPERATCRHPYYFFIRSVCRSVVAKGLDGLLGN